MPSDVEVRALTESIDALLPQTQCTRCGYPACRPYAEAIARDEAAINQCPPGGAPGITRLAQLLGRPELPLNPANGIEQPLRLARIDEAVCIGCTLCIQACPTDAIVGAAKQMHTVLLDACTGCELCLPPCPVDCISLVPDVRTWDDTRAATARRHFETRNLRLARLASSDPGRMPLVSPALPRQADLPATLADTPPGAESKPSTEADADAETKLSQARKRAVLQAALERSRAQRHLR